ncbi:PREDICTED: rab-interacting lysosomal protein [Nanorana parkeri]|uniref:rab-interacting lysosomal protein n=1 Tax=Nanorana parkeri TaxID=125878 RepID=UPI0008545583|nr:PREDICTED: rab-interacting lysosomal protein [Nanorana parkeri]
MESAERVWRRAPAALSLEDVYSMATSLGSELQSLTEQYGPESVSGVVPQVVRVLELLENFAATGRERSCPEQELLIRAVQSMGREERQSPDLEQKLLEAQRKEHDLQNQLSHLTDENQKLLGHLAETKSQGECAAREERDLMLKLKVVVDRQRDEIRSLTRENHQRNKDTEALQEQLNRVMNVNEDLRRKMAVVNTQLKSSLQRKTELEGLLQAKQKDMDSLTHKLLTPQAVPDKNMNTTDCKSQEDNVNESTSSQMCFTKEDVKQIVQERNELKTNLFLVNEELKYYQRELLNDERIPTLLLCGMKSAIRKQRKKIKAKMLGIVESPTSSDEEDGSWSQMTATDCVDSKPPESKIRSLFGTWYGKQTPEPGPWEIINSKEINMSKKEGADDNA